MRPSSSPSEGLLDAVFGRGAAAAQATDTAWLQAMLDMEAALARALAAAGCTTPEVAAAIGRCCRAELYDQAELGRATVSSGNPAIPVVAALTAAVRESSGPDAAGQVHRGATSQDVLDTATMLVASRALDHLGADLAAVADRCAELAAEHAGTVMPGRTLLQPALPTTFGLKAAGWLTAVDAVRGQVARVAREALAVQLGGAAGTLASLGADADVVVGHLARELGLVEPVLPWHTDRTRVLALAGALAATTGVLGKVGRDVTLLAQAEVAEVSEGGGPGRGGSSTMPHKRNPVAAVTLVALAHRAPGLLATLAAGMPQEHERAAGAWQAEWESVRALVRCAGAAAAWARELLDGLQVHPDRMRANLDATGGLPMAENVTTVLTGALGRGDAHRLVEEACRVAAVEGRPLADVLAADRAVLDRLGRDGIARALDPATSLTAVPELVRRALHAHARGLDAAAGPPGPRAADDGAALRVPPVLPA
jgi:3-carboxy-cis,cis-muconate cycloisomerase